MLFGSFNASIVHPREIFKLLIRKSCASAIVVFWCCAIIIHSFMFRSTCGGLGYNSLISSTRASFNSYRSIFPLYSKLRM
ncbi:hypothetical protein FG382_15875 [Psychrobacillus lasiicapitis]|uniref:Uncharacterized protein n=1 Tax=Psychrobacillus lasiicapitis TaxID=1636719 RepID=A0A544T218_9BACI|nr:hypothetical protein FG382_15875 [Psychrobacillus lasiicapitis]